MIPIILLGVLFLTVVLHKPVPRGYLPVTLYSNRGGGRPSVLAEWWDHPKGTIPVVWRWFLGPYRRGPNHPLFKDKWIIGGPRGGIIDMRQGLKMKGCSMISEEKLVEKFRSRMMLVLRVITVLIFFFYGIPIVVGATLVWSGSGLASNGANWTGGGGGSSAAVQLSTPIANLNFFNMQSQPNAITSAGGLKVIATINASSDAIIIYSNDNFVSNETVKVLDAVETYRDMSIVRTSTNEIYVLGYGIPDKYRIFHITNIDTSDVPESSMVVNDALSTTGANIRSCIRVDDEDHIHLTWFENVVGSDFLHYQVSKDPNPSAMTGAAINDIWWQDRGVSIAATDIAFKDLNPDTIVSASSNFVAAGFVAGDTVHVTGSISNGGANYLIAAGGVAITTLTLDAGEAVVAETGQVATLTAAVDGSEAVGGLSNSGVFPNMVFDGTDILLAANAITTIEILKKAENGTWASGSSVFSAAAPSTSGCTMAVNHVNHTEVVMFYLETSSGDIKAAVSRDFGATFDTTPEHVFTNIGIATASGSGFDGQNFFVALRDTTPDDVNLFRRNSVTATDISFNDVNPDTIVTAGAVNFLTAGFVAGETITINGSTSNDGIFLINTVTSTTITLDIGESLTGEVAGNNVTLSTYTDVTPGDIDTVDVMNAPVISHQSYGQVDETLIDLMWGNETDDRIEFKSIGAGGAPVAGDDVVFNATSTNNCTWDINAAFNSYNTSSAYTGTITQTVAFEIDGTDFDVDAASTFVGSGLVTISGTGNFQCLGLDDLSINTTSTYTLTGDSSTTTVDFNGLTGTFAHSNFNITVDATSGTPWQNSSSKVFTGTGSTIFDGAIAGTNVNIEGNFNGIFFRSTNSGSIGNVTADVNVNENVRINDSGPTNGYILNNNSGFNFIVGDVLLILDDGTFNINPTAALNSTITCVSLTVNTGGEIDYDTSLSSTASVLNVTGNIVLNAGSISHFEGISGFNLDMNIGGCRVAGDVTSFRIIQCDVDTVGGTTACVDFEIAQTGTILIQDSSLTHTTDVAVRFSAAWTTQNEGTQFDGNLYSGATQDIDLAAAAIVVMQDCFFNSVDVFSGGMVWSYTVATSNQVWGTATVGGGGSSVGAVILADLDNPFEIYEDQNGSNNASVTWDSTQSITGHRSRVAPLGVDSANNTVIVNTGNTLTIAATATVTAHSFGVFTLTGNFVWSPTTTNNQTMDLLNDVTMIGSWTSEPTSSGITIKIHDTKRIVVNDAAATLVLKGQNISNRLTVTTQDSPSINDRGFIRVSTGTGNAFQFVDFINLGRASTSDGPITFGGTSDGTIDDCFFSSDGNNPGIVFGVVNVSWIMQTCNVNGFTSHGILIQAAHPSLVIRDCIVEDSAIELFIRTTGFTGLIENSHFTGGNRAAIFQIDIGNGAIRNCFFGSGSSDIIRVDTSATVNLVGCLFDLNGSFDVQTGSELHSWYHNRTNTRKSFLSGAIVVDSAFETVVNFDNFDWNTTKDDWDLNAQFRLESQTAVVTPAKSNFITAQPSTTYFVKWSGDVDSVDIQEYKLGQIGTNTLRNIDSGTATFTTDSDTYFLQWELDASAANEQYHDAEIRETNSTGVLIWNEDFFNRYQWEPEWDYINFRLSAAVANTDVLTFGDADYEKFTFTVDLISLSAQGGVVLAYQDSNNYYEVVAVQGAPDVIEIAKIVAGVRTVLDTSVTAIAISASDTLIVDYDATGANSTFKVNYTGTQIVSWVTAGATDTVTDSTYSNGGIGFSGSDVFFDSYLVEHECLFYRDLDLCVSAGTTILVQNGGCFNYKRGTVNASRTIVTDEVGSVFTDIDVTWADTVYNPIVDNVQVMACTKITTTGDIVLGINGQLNWDGVQVKHVDPTQLFRIITKNSNQDPPFAFRGVELLNLKTSIRPISTIEPAYVLDPTFEFITRSSFHEKDIRIIENRVFGRLANRSFVHGHGNYEIDIQFTVEDDLCLLGTMERWKQEELLLELISPGAQIYECKIKEVDTAAIDPSNPFLIRFIVTFVEFR